MQCRCPDCGRLLFIVEGDVLSIKCKCGHIAKGSIQELRSIMSEFSLDHFKMANHGDLLLSEDHPYSGCGRLLFVLDEGGIQINCWRCKGKWQYSVDDFSAIQRPKPDGHYWEYPGFFRPLVVRFPEDDQS